jgi:CubicO group peptidase (beta-lactamase class C family)
MRKHARVTELQGQWQPDFAPLIDAFRGNFAGKQEIGAAICVYRGGRKVVDVWAGYKDAKRKIPWTENTLTTIFSVTKALTSLCFLILALRKKFDYDKPVSFYWPDFALGGKKDISCRLLLEHRAGLYAVETPLTIGDFVDNKPKIYNALAMQKPFFVPGSMQAYGAQVWGAYAAELFVHVAGESVGTFFAREVARRLGANCFIGLPPEYENDVATLYPVSPVERLAHLVPDIIKGETTEGRIGRAFISGNKSIEQAYMNPSAGLKSLEIFNESWVHRLELPWVNGVAHARSLAQVMNVLALGGKAGKLQFANAALMAELTKENALRYDLVLQKPLGWNLGFLKEERWLYSPNVEAFGHSGMGGPLALADPKTKLAFGYVCNKMDYKVRPDKTLKLCRALYECV